MSLQLDVKLLEGLSGKGQRIVKAKFRDSELSTRLAEGQNACYFGAELVWRVARRLEDNDELVITAYDVSKYRPKRAIGSVTVNLATLAQKQVLSLEEPLVDANKMVTSVTLSFDLYYRPPDQGEADLDIERFGHPLADLHHVRSADDLGEGDADFGEDAMDDAKDLMDLYGFGDGTAMNIDNLSEKSSVLSGPVRRDPKLRALIDPTILKSETFTVSVTIVEAKGLPGVNVNPMVEITAAGKTRKTDVKFYTNNPYYNKFFSFEYFLPRVAVLDELVWIRVYSLNAKMIARLLPGKLIGEFVIDVRSIFESKGHVLTNKWAVLIDPKKPLSGPQGYVRIDLAFLGKDDIPKHIKHEKDDEDISLEGNQLVPKGITNLSKRNITEFSVKIYRAEGLPPMNTDIITSIKQAFVGDSAPMCDPYVEVSFGGHTAKTKVKKYTYTPIWNQEIVFCDFFPPLTHTIRLAVRDWEAVKDETIATHLIDLKQILDKSSENVMPTFGPSWVNLYGSPRTYTYEQARRPDDELNKSLGEGVAYRGRLLIAIKAQPSKDAMKTGAILRGTPPVSETFAMDQIYYLLQRRKPGSARHRMRQILLYKSRIFRKAANDVRSCRGTAPKTLLDLSYQRRVRADLLRIEILLKRLGRKLTGANLYEAIREANAVIKRLSELMDCPQHGLPDVFVSMVLDNKRIGFVRIPARDIYYSASDEERGKLASQVTTHFVRKPGHEGVGEKGWRIQCQLRMYTWLGLVKDYLAYKRGLPEGYDPECVSGVDPPKSLIYVDSSKFELRCYLYLAKNLLASNKTGFSDPMARVLINDEMLETFPIYDTMSPLWDLTLIKTNITFYHKPESVLANPPQIIVEFFDVDAPKTSNFLGRCFCEPNIIIKGADYQPPPLQWWQIYRGQTTAGKLLASFDLIEIDALDDIDAIPTVEDLADFTRRFNERVLLGPACGIPFSDDSDDYGEYGEQWDDEMQQAARLLDEDAMAQLDAPIEEADDSYSLLSTSTSGSLATTATTTRKKKKTKAKVGLATADLVRWRADDALRLPENVRPPLGRYRLEVFTLPLLSFNPVVYDEYEESSTPVESEVQPEGKAPIFSKALAGLGDPDAEETRSAEEAMLQAGRYGAPQQPSQGSSASGNGDDEDDEDEDEYSRKDSVTRSKPSTTMTLTTETHPGMYTERDPILKNVPKKATSILGGYDGPLGKVVPQAGLKTFPVNPMTKLSKQQLNTLDWWSRLFASLNDIDIGDDSAADDDIEEADSRFDDNLEKVELLPEDIGMEEEVVAEIPDEVVVQGGRKSRRNQIRKFFRLKPKKELTALEKFEKQKEKERLKKAKKSKRGKGEPKLLLKIRGDAKKAFLKEVQDDLIITSAGIDTSLIERIKIYSSELEEVPDFQGFCSPIRNFKLFRGKQDDDDMTAEERAVGYFKGNLKLYPIPEDADPPESVEELHSFSILPQRTRWRVLVRCYIIRAFNLHPADPTGLADPYLIVSMGKEVFNEKSNYIPKTLRPTFGKMFQFEVEFPTTTILHIEVMDHDILGSDDVIGQTVIDLESRFYSPHRATCGLAQTYYSHSYAQWRDNKLPTEILSDLCQKSGLPPPVYTQIDNTVKVGGKEFYADTTIVDETESTKKSNEPLALAALNHWDEVPGGTVLVPEHVEVRRLLHPEKGSLEQGRLMMWVDMFDRDEGKPPPPIDVTPRTPEPWELRCIIYNTAEVVLNDTSLFSNEKSADIYVRGWMLGVGEDDQKTDVHYRSLSGEGNFNWRFVFPFNYMRYEDRIVFARKKAFDIDPAEVKMPCDLTLQVWDNELVRSDKFLGSIALKLSRMPRPAKTPATCGLHQLEESCPTLSLFENKQIRGWWPLVIHDEDEGVDVVQGKVEVELHLVSGQDAEASPVGKGHEEPEALPQPEYVKLTILQIKVPI
ncbi:Otoferlin [Echinococcus granulosus]|nr:Otoferlin [Echinococcus granulosus]